MSDCTKDQPSKCRLGENVASELDRARNQLIGHMKSFSSGRPGLAPDGVPTLINNPKSKPADLA